jgi:RNA polymerase sigma-70 factor (ECF subfamily)
MPPPEQPAHSHFAPFPATRWSIVVEAGGGTTPESRRALEEICTSYWPPLYAFIRRSGFNREDSEDLTQDFLRRLLERDTLAAVDAEKGKLRTFLLVSLKNFLKDFRKHESALKRGGGKVVSFDAELAESLYSADFSESETPETLFAKHWAQTILESVFDELATEHDQSGKSAQFDALCPFLQRNSGAGRYADVATKLGISEGAVKVAVYRLRKRYRDVFRTRVMETVADERELDDEVAFFFQAIGN